MKWFVTYTWVQLAWERWTWGTACRRRGSRRCCKPCWTHCQCRGRADRSELQYTGETADEDVSVSTNHHKTVLNHTAWDTAQWHIVCFKADYSPWFPHSSLSVSSRSCWLDSYHHQGYRRMCVVQSLLKIPFFSLVWVIFGNFLLIR